MFRASSKALSLNGLNRQSTRRSRMCTRAAASRRGVMNTIDFTGRVEDEASQ